MIIQHSDVPKRIGFWEIISLVGLAYCLSFSDLLPVYGQAGGGFRYLEISVLDEQGQPIPDATLDIVTKDMEFPLGVSEEGVASFNMSTEEGAAGYLKLTARANDYVAEQVWWRGSAIPSEFSFHLAPGQAIGGVVETPNGKPIEGVHVEALLLGSESSGQGKPIPHINHEVAVTDSQGKWIAKVAPKEQMELRLKLSHPDYYSDRGFGARRPPDAQLRSLEHIEVLEELLPPQGVVLDAEGKPVADAKVYLKGYDGTFSVKNGKLTSTEGVEIRTADEQGKFLIESEEEDFVLLFLDDAGWATVPAERFNRNKPLEVQLTAWARIKGSLADDGQPVADTPVGVAMTIGQDAYDSQVEWTHSATTDGAGNFVCDRLIAGPGVLGRLLAYCGESNSPLVSQEATFFLTAGQESVVTVNRTGRTVEGYVVGIRENGIDIPIRCGAILFTKQNLGANIMQNIFFGWGKAISINSEGIVQNQPVTLGTEVAPLEFAATVDQEGRFNAERIPPGTYHVSVSLQARSRNTEEDEFLWGNFDDAVVVPAVTEGGSSPVDLGELEIQVWSDSE